ncbi:MAG: hypothetical protein ACK6D3_05460 [Planctomycetaceae bacterium]|jgi:hypothetical protein
MASWHIFMQGWKQRLFSRIGGGFSVYREGLDRQALNTAIEILHPGVMHCPATAGTESPWLNRGEGLG